MEFVTVAARVPFPVAVVKYCDRSSFKDKGLFLAAVQGGEARAAGA